MALQALVSLLFLVASSRAMPNGPPSGACGSLRPDHPGTEQTSATPVITSTPATFTPSGDPVQLIILVQGIPSLRGVMIQARSANNPNGLPLGSFTIPASNSAKLTTQSCARADDTANHMNPTDVPSVTVDWNPPAIDDATDIKFYYTIVQELSTYWVMQSTATVQCIGCIEEEDVNTALIKAHGSVMTVAWGVLVPIGILLALFYKVVWPEGEWFYAHVVILSTALGLVLIGIVLIVVHAEGKWLNTTPVNTPHQVLGIVATVAIAVNPFLAILRCDPQSQWRPIYNWVHGTIGLLAAQCVAFAAMLLGLNIFRELASSPDRVHYAIYTTSATVGLVLMLIALYNIYNVSFHKAYPRPSDFSSPSQLLGSPQHEDPDDDFESSRDSPLRAAVGIVIAVVLLLIAIVSIVLMSLA